MSKVRMTLEEALRLAVYALRNDNAKGALKLLEDVLSAVDARQQEEPRAEETPEATI